MGGLFQFPAGGRAIVGPLNALAIVVRIEAKMDAPGQVSYRLSVRLGDVRRRQYPLRNLPGRKGLLCRAAVGVRHCAGLSWAAAASHDSRKPAGARSVSPLQIAASVDRRLPDFLQEFVVRYQTAKT